MKNLPNHVALIMDGNGRWAKARGLRREMGHREGLRTAQKIIDHAQKRGVRFVSLYVFSTENWKRPKAEIKALFALAEKYLDDFSKFCENGVRVVVSGEREKLPPTLVQKVEEIKQKTAHFDAICVNLCIDYGGRREIVEAAKKALANGQELTEESLEQNLYNSFIPMPDLIVRTGGHKRLSNFLLYQSAYAELYFSDTLWPDFGEEEFDRILEDFGGRTRNFGAV